jgi:ribosomal protein S14
MKVLIAKDKKRRLLLKNAELRRLLLKYIINSEYFDFQYKQLAQKLLNKFTRDSSSVRIKNRCVFTGRAKGVFSKFRVSRILFKTLSLAGYLPGIRKSSW